MPKYRANLSVKSFRKLAKDIRKYRHSLQDKCEEFAYRMAEEGVNIAQMKILSFDAVMTGELLSSMNLEAGNIVSNGASYYVYAIGRLLLSLGRALPESQILIQIPGLRIGSMIPTITEKPGGGTLMMENGTGQKVCRLVRLCMRQGRSYGT